MYYLNKFESKKKTKLSPSKSGGGFTLLEVIVALFVVTVGIMGVMTLIYQTMVLSSNASNRLMAAYLAQEGIEIVRNIRDTNWLEGDVWDEGLITNSNCPIGCIADYNHSYDSADQLDPDLPAYSGQFLYIDTNGFYNYSSGSPTRFQRKITIGPGPIADSLKVSVEIFWQERGKSYSFPVKEHLYKWY